MKLREEHDKEIKNIEKAKYEIILLHNSSWIQSLNHV